MVYMYHSFLIHSSADGHLGCFHVLAIINSVAMDVSLSDLVSSVCMPRSGIAGSYGSSSSSFLRNLHTFVVCQKPTRQCEQLITLCCAQSCLTLCDPPASSPPDYPAHGILQARILERVAISYSWSNYIPIWKILKNFFFATTAFQTIFHPK